MDTQTKNSLVIQVRLAASRYNIVFIVGIVLFKIKDKSVNLSLK